MAKVQWRRVGKFMRQLRQLPGEGKRKKLFRALGPSVVSDMVYHRPSAACTTTHCIKTTPLLPLRHPFPCPSCSDMEATVAEAAGAAGRLLCCRSRTVPL